MVEFRKDHQEDFVWQRVDGNWGGRHFDEIDKDVDGARCTTPRQKYGLFMRRRTGRHSLFTKGKRKALKRNFQVAQAPMLKIETESFKPITHN